MAEDISQVEEGEMRASRPMRLGEIYRPDAGPEVTFKPDNIQPGCPDMMDRSTKTILKRT